MRYIVGLNKGLCEPMRAYGKGEVSSTRGAGSLEVGGVRAGFLKDA